MSVCLGLGLYRGGRFDTFLSLSLSLSLFWMCRAEYATQLNIPARNDVHAEQLNDIDDER